MRQGGEWAQDSKAAFIVASVTREVVVSATREVVAPERREVVTLERMKVEALERKEVVAPASRCLSGQKGGGGGEFISSPPICHLTASSLIIRGKLHKEEVVDNIIHFNPKLIKHIYLYYYLVKIICYYHIKIESMYYCELITAV